MNICSALINRERTGILSLDHGRLCRRPPIPRATRDDPLDDDNDDAPPTKKSKSTTFVQLQPKPCPLLNVRLNIDQVISKKALESGHVVMGFTHCNRYILSYTIRQAAAHGPFARRDYQPSAQNENHFYQPLALGGLEEFDTESLYTYKLYFWRFVPHKLAKKYSSVLLFDRNGVSDSNLMIQMAQWRYEEFDNERFLLIVGRSSTPEDNPRCYLTLTSLPPSSPCRKCSYIYSEVSHAQTLSPCPSHSLTMSLSYEVVSPFPPFEPSLSLFVTEGHVPTVLLNTGNLFHQIQFNPSQPKYANKNNVLKAELNGSGGNNAELSYYYKNLIPNYDPKERRFFKRTRLQANAQRLQLVESFRKKPDIYDLFNDDDSKIDKNYRLFRNRQLADKKYEFVDTPSVLRPLHNSNKKASHHHHTQSQVQSSKTVYIKKCMAKVTRSYVLLNEESVSTTTEIEDNEYNFNEFPVALPTAVYTDQTQLSMIPNYKAVDSKVIVTQTSLDLEILSNELASIICKKEGMRFVFLIDFDAVLIQVHPTECTITALVLVLIQATTSKEDAARVRYETNYMFQWNPATQSSKILFKGKLKQVPNNLDVVWNPSTELAIEALRLYKQANPHLHNKQMVDDWISADELHDWAGIVTLYRGKALAANSAEDDYDDVISLFSDD